MKIREIIKEAEVVDRPPVHQQQEVPVHLPGGATVVVFSDDYTPFEVAVEAVSAVIGLSPEEASKRMMKAHHQGWADVAAYASVDMAETKADQIMRHARNNTNYDHYRRMARWNQPWPLHAEVREADGSEE